MKTTLYAVVALSCAVFTPSCAGRDVDIGNGADNIQDKGAGGTKNTVGTGTGSGTTVVGDNKAGTGTAGTTVIGDDNLPGTTGGGSSTVGDNSAGTTGGGGAAGMSGVGGAAGLGDSSVTARDAGDGSASSRPTSAIVLRYGDIPLPTGSGTGTTGTTGTGGGVIIDPDTPYLFLGNGPPACRDPYGDYSCGRWGVTIGIPRSLFKPGILSLGDSRLISVMSVQGPDRGGGDCSGGGGSFTQGTLEIVQIGATVSVRLANTSTFDFAADGAYEAAICP